MLITQRNSPMCLSPQHNTHDGGMFLLLGVLGVTDVTISKLNLKKEGKLFFCYICCNMVWYTKKKYYMIQVYNHMINICIH